MGVRCMSSAELVKKWMWSAFFSNWRMLIFSRLNASLVQNDYNMKVRCLFSVQCGTCKKRVLDAFSTAKIVKFRVRGKIFENPLASTSFSVAS